MKLKIIAAIGQNNELGKDNNLIWKLPNDLHFFKETTINKTVVMGKNTFYSLPKVLPNRKNIVITDSKIENGEIIQYSSIEDFIYDYKDSDEEVFIIGGAMIYKQFIDLADELYLTEIDASAEADVFFPNFNKDDYEKIELGSNSDGDIYYSHILYRRVKR
ncbi:MAG: dihydrofolate reductase [Bacilli bacterium]|nr:dihydrofolate reductase [Bacilli bacterium]